MNIYDILVIIILIVVVGFALKETIAGFKGKNKCLSCGGDCSHCAQTCSKKEKS